MNGLTGKGLFAAGALLATVTGWGYDMGDVVGEADVTANLDTRGDTPIVVSSVDEAFDLAWNNAADWRKGGDGEGAGDGRRHEPRTCRGADDRTRDQGS